MGWTAIIYVIEMVRSSYDRGGMAELVSLLILVDLGGVAMESDRYMHMDEAGGPSRQRSQSHVGGEWRRPS